MRQPGRIVILGAGPTGLGAAYRLRELGYGDDYRDGVAAFIGKRAPRFSGR